MIFSSKCCGFLTIYKQLQNISMKGLFHSASAWTGPISRNLLTPSPPINIEKPNERPNIIVRMIFKMLFGKN